MSIKALLIAGGTAITLGGALIATTATTPRVTTAHELQASGADIIQMQDDVIIAEFPSLEDAVIISSYPSDLILESINNGTTIDGFTFATK